MLDDFTSRLRSLTPGQMAWMTQAEFDQTFRSFEPEAAKSVALNAIAQHNKCDVRVGGEGPEFVVFTRQTYGPYEQSRRG